MLVELHIENLGIINRVDLVIGSGLTALTGETGAGKTLIVEAIELLTGSRADPTIVRHGADEARIDGRFVRPDGMEIILSRVIPTAGRSRAYVDGRLATAASLAEITGRMVDLHGQHTHQSLLSIDTQRKALDVFGKIDLKPLCAARDRVTKLEADLAALGGDERAREREIDLLRFQVNELNAAHIDDPHEDVALDAEESLLADALGHRLAGNTAHQVMVGEGGARDAVEAALTALHGRDPYDETVARLHSLLAELDDLVAAIRNRADRIDESPERLAEVRERRQGLADLRRKYGEDLTAVMTFRAEAERRLRELESYDRRASELATEQAMAIRAERTAAEVVGGTRRVAAELLAQAVQDRLHALALPHAQVAVDVGEHPDDHPGDRVRFLFASNPGSAMLPLSRVASGGELARAMLAVRLVLSEVGRGMSVEHDGIETLVFDEIDAGMGGEAATAIGAALADLAQHHQVLVVTHLAQVAAAATAQVSVSKQVVGGQTFATAALVDGQARVDEIARMLSGTVGKSARIHARELLTESV